VAIVRRPDLPVVFERDAAAEAAARDFARHRVVSLAHARWSSTPPNGSALSCPAPRHRDAGAGQCNGSALSCPAPRHRDAGAGQCAPPDRITGW
jgi:hypothetical protein